MSGYQTQLPELVWVCPGASTAAPGQGAYFMELASLLAGEQWSDHPACTHLLLTERVSPAMSTPHL
jgi:hypothetical protein